MCLSLTLYPARNKSAKLLVDHADGSATTAIDSHIFARLRHQIAG